MTRWDGDESITAPHAEHIGPKRLRAVTIIASGIPGHATTMVGLARCRRVSWIADTNLIVPGRAPSMRFIPPPCPRRAPRGLTRMGQLSCAVVRKRAGDRVMRAVLGWC
jgi:hypothetical protein